MAQRSEQLKTTAEPELQERVDDFGDQRGYDTRSDAVYELVRVGLRETESPIMHRLKDAGIRVGAQLLVVGVLVGVLGAATPLLEPFVAGQVAAILLLFGVGAMASAELVRILAGRNEIGDELRRWSGSR